MRFSKQLTSVPILWSASDFFPSPRIQGVQIANTGGPTISLKSGMLRKSREGILTALRLAHLLS